MEKENRIININLPMVVRMLIADKRKIIIFTCVSGLVGLILAFCTPKIYKSTVILAPEESGAGFSGSLSSLASMVGMNIKVGQTGDAIYPEIYPGLMSSNNFIVDLFPVTVTRDETGEQYTYQDYLQHHQREAFYIYPGIWIKKMIEGLTSKQSSDIHKVNPFRLTKDEYKIVKVIKKRISCSVDKKTNVITITVEDRDPLIAATMADSVQVHLQHAITNYRTKKARIDLEYMQQLFDEAKEQYRQARQAYAACADSYQNVKLQSYAQKVNELENEMQLKFTIYQQISEQLHLAKAKVQERIPAFTIVQGASVPVKSSSLPKVVSLFIWMILGFMLRISMLLWKNRQQFINI
ncbi:Wzz/FepE/Etk N-terminal domain-containing protein [Xylanibacter ruminicola]|uniref:Wzz/FepE/Etk N-terminal domain-containing protein n=1 Tax=Xylanibacter ruminicola TaxID=839 RepID=UPI00048FE9C7|nr:Wzz/FepE/Etk N-terminal domain-containing protein [Xylanibacter ruminicola]